MITNPLLNDDVNNLVQDILQDFILKERSYEFYSHICDLLDIFMNNIQESNIDLLIMNSLKRIMDVVYFVDLSEIDNWEQFIIVVGEQSPIAYNTINQIVLNRDKRKPPKPKFYYTSPRGYCRYCGKMIVKPDGTLDKRKNWHPECADEYRIIYEPAETRKAVFKRDGGVCHVCGCVDDRLNGSWDVDHLVPLSESNGKIDAWKMTNVATKCIGCHREKTALENSRRSQRKREHND